MRDFQFFVTDDRYTVPTIVFVEAQDVRAARDLARQLMASHPHYRSVQAFAGEEPLFTVSGRFSDVWTREAISREHRVGAA